jgi:hypothetical protein
MKIQNCWIVWSIYFLVNLILFLPIKLLSQEYFITDSYFIDDICSSDIDLDGDNDLIISSSSNGLPDSLYIFYNDGNGNPNKTSLARRNGIFVDCGNIDDDEYPDIITKDGSSILFIKNNGDGTFGDEIILAPTNGNRVIEYITDMDGDGMNDLVYTYNGYYCKWGILKNESGLIFTDHIIYDNGMGTNLFPIIGNLNNDSLPDASLEFTTEGIHVLMNKGNLTFDSSLLCSTNGYPVICTLNLTPPEDILVLSPNTDELILYENLGDNAFNVRNTIPLIDALGLNDFADFNNDGYDDLCYSICWWNECTDSIYISINDQNWSFYDPQYYYVGPMEFLQTETADLNGDSFIDIIIYGYSPRNAFKILWNDGFGGFSYENPVGVSENSKSNKFFEVDFSPNPFTSSIHIIFKSITGDKYKISVIDLFGRPIKDLHSENIKINETQDIIWNGRDFSERDVRKGIYFLIFSDDRHYIQSEKIIKY